MRQGGEEPGPRPGRPSGSPTEGATPPGVAGGDTVPPERRTPAARISGLGSGLLARQPPPAPGEGVNVRKICPHCGTEYETDARFCPKDGAALRPTGGSDPLIGHTLGDRYHILSLVGEGGMGRIYLAEHVRMSRQCAVKIMRPNLVNDADAASRFAREASSAARIIHPNVAAVFDYGESDGHVYLVMEFVEGDSLGALLERERVLPLDRTLDLGRQVADALAAAHELGIVHRDLKPDNILITRTKSGREVPKVVDFGIAKAIEEGPGQKLTETGLVIGTPEFMSPEQLMGDPVDARSDVYSLGCILYLMLVGVAAADAPTRDGMLKRRLSETAPHPRAENEALPPEVDAIVAKALAPLPADRFQSAGELRDALAAAAATLGGPDAGRAPAISGEGAARDSGGGIMPADAAGQPVGWYSPRRGLGVAGVLLLGVAALFLLKTDRGPQVTAASPIQGADSVGGVAQPTIRAVSDSAAAGLDTTPVTAGAATPQAPRVVTPPRPSPAESARADSVRRAASAAAALRAELERAIEQFASAVSSRNIETLRAAYPGLTQSQEREWARNFKGFDRISTRVRYGTPVVGPDGRARQPFSLALTYYDNGTASSASADYLGVYDRVGGRWVLRTLQRP